MRLKRDAQVWEHFAHVDPLWAISTEPQFHKCANQDVFFRNGERDVQMAFALLRHLGIDVPRARALDFGCGVGRLTRALATEFNHVVGVDISEEMLSRARQITPCNRIDFRLNQTSDLSMLDTDSFDFVLSVAVLQHVMDHEVIAAYIREFVRVTRPGGAIIFQLPANMPFSARLIRRVVRPFPVTWVYRVPALRSHLMSLAALPEDTVRAVVASTGAETRAALPDNRLGTPAIRSLAYCVSVRRT